MMSFYNQKALMNLTTENPRGHGVGDRLVGFGQHDVAAAVQLDHYLLSGSVD